MADDNTTQGVEFQSPTTGARQVVPPEHWDEALKSGYTPTQHTVMYDPNGNRGMVPKAEMPDYTRRGYQTTPETSTEATQRTKRGFLGTIADKASDAWKSVTDTSRPLPPIPKSTSDFNPNGFSEIKRQALRPIPKDLPTDSIGAGSPGTGAMLYRGATTLSPLVPFLNPEASEAASAKGDTGAVAAEAAIPAAASAAATFGPKLVSKAARASLPARTALAERIVQPLVYEGVGEAGADTRMGISPERGIVKEGIWGTRPSMVQQTNARLNLLKPAANKILQTAPGASKFIDAAPSINSAVDDAIAQAYKNGQGSIVPRLEELRDSLLTKHGGTAGVPLDINNLKTSIQDTASQLGAFKNTVPAEASAASTAGRAASNIRGQVNTAVPEAAPINERMSDVIDARAGLQRGIEAQKGKPIFGGGGEGIPSRILNNTVGSPLVRSGAARLISLGAKADIPTPPTPMPAFPPGPVVGPVAGQPAPQTGGPGGPMITPAQTPVPPTGPGNNVALFPDIPSGQAPSPILGAGEVPNWPPKTPDWSPVNNAPPIPNAQSTVAPPTQPAVPSSSGAPPPASTNVPTETTAAPPTGGPQVPPTLPPLPAPAPINPQELADFTKELRGMGYQGPITNDNINELMRRANEMRSATAGRQGPQ